MDVPTNRFRADVLRGLSAAAKAIPSKYFYDEAGSKLFDKICELDEYYPTRTELAIMERHADEMADLAGPACLLVEYGSGSSVKSRLLLDRLDAPAAYVPVDISREHLLTHPPRPWPAPTRAWRCCRSAPTSPGRSICPLPADRPGAGVVYFPGSTIGNFTPEEAIDLLRRTAQLGGPGSGTALGRRSQERPRNPPRRLQRPARRHGGVQPEPPHAHQPRAGGRLSNRTSSGTTPSTMPRKAASRCT